jgi:hypothetical protein
VGMREVGVKRKEWRARADDKGAEFLGRHMIPAILGPKDRHYVIDHHHLARALHEEGVRDVLVTVVANLRRLDRDSFWFVLDNRGWMHPFDDQGRRRGYEDIPKAVKDLVDDPFRSLAGELRRLGGFAKNTTPSVSFSGRISCAGDSSARPSRPISTEPWNRRSVSREARRPTTCPDGAAPSRADSLAAP